MIGTRIWDSKRASHTGSARFATVLKTFWSAMALTFAAARRAAALSDLSRGYVAVASALLAPGFVNPRLIKQKDGTRWPIGADYRTGCDVKSPSVSACRSPSGPSATSRKIGTTGAMAATGSRHCALELSVD